MIVKRMEWEDYDTPLVYGRPDYLAPTILRYVTLSKINKMVK